MKNVISQHGRKLFLALGALCLVSLFGATSLAQARDNDQSYSNRHRVSSKYQDQRNYRDSRGNYHRQEYRNNRRGYWNENNGFRIWINL